MAQPYDYSIQVPNPTNQVVGALQASQGIQAMRAQKDAAAASKQIQSELLALSKNPTSGGVIQLITKYPQLSEQFKGTLDALDSKEKDARISQASQVYAAMQSGQYDVAREYLIEQAEGYKNAGRDKDAKAMEDMAKFIEMDPKSAMTSTGVMLAATMGDKFAETFTKLEQSRREQSLEGATLTEAQAKAEKAAIDSSFAEAQSVMDLQKKGWDIYKIQEDTKIAKENSKIAAMRADLARESNELRRAQLETKLNDAMRKRDEEVRTKAADVESARGNIDNMLNTLDRIAQSPLGVIENATGPVDQWTPTIRQSTADFQELVKNLDAQAFLAQIPNIKGMGALSNAEGEKLAAALQNFSLRQSPQQLIKNVREAQRLITKARENISTRYGAPETIPDTPDVQTGPEDIDSLIQQYAPDVP